MGKSKPALVRSLASIAPSVAQAADNWLAESRRMVAAAKRDADKDIQRSAAQEADGGSAQPMPEGPSPADSGPVTIDQDPRIRDHRGWYTLNSDLSDAVKFPRLKMWMSMMRGYAAVIK